MDLSICSKCTFFNKANSSCNFPFSKISGTLLTSYIEKFKNTPCVNIITCSKMIETLILQLKLCIIPEKQIIEQIESLISTQKKAQNNTFNPLVWARKNPNNKYSKQILETQDIKQKVNSILRDSDYSELNCIYYDELRSIITNMVRNNELINVNITNSIANNIRQNFNPASILRIKPFPSFRMAMLELNKLLNNNSYNFDDTIYKYKPLNLLDIKKYFSQAIVLLKFLAYLKEDKNIEVDISPTLNEYNTGKCWIYHYDIISNSCSIGISSKHRDKLKEGTGNKVDIIYNYFHLLFSNAYKLFFLQVSDKDFFDVHHDLNRLSY